MELIKTKLDLCTGCNRCVRVCPMENVNITYQDADGNIKVKIDHDKCIDCGRCLYACRHNARYYVDDSQRFFDDLAKGVPVSLIAAPSIQTNIPDWKRLFTYLKQLGVNKIYDVSLGADICIWANIRHIEKNESLPIITQPCPVIVSYCEMYKQDLLKNLSPAQSPMACTSIYMKEYNRVSDRIAALSPCIAKADEFRATGLADYSITFAKLKDYLEKNKIKLPTKETGFDSDESNLGSILPMPGGLKETIDFFTDNKLSIDKAEGSVVFKMLDTYAESPADSLPHVFDVLNCREGCNVGTACTNSANIFKINREMDKRRKAAIGSRKKEYFEELHKKYDNTFALSKFTRVYKPSQIQLPQITDKDIEKAFLKLNKTNSKKQAVDCGACGSDTCRGMARKIALGVNIPINCIVKSMEDAKLEHEENLATHSQLSEMERVHETDELMRIMLDANPFGANFWNKNFELIDINAATVNMLKLSSKKEYMENFNAFSPEYQSDGRLSTEASSQYIRIAFEKGHANFEWTHQAADGEEIPCEITMVRVDYKGDPIVATFVRDLREHKRMMGDIDKQDILLNVINRLAVVLLAATNEEYFRESLVEGMEIIGQVLEADCVQIWKNEMIDGVLHFVLGYKWLSECGKKAQIIPIGTAVPYSKRWKELFLRGECINGPINELPQEDQDMLKPLGLVSTITIPLYHRDEFWGIFCVDDCVKKRYFNESENSILNSAGLMLVNAVNRNSQAVEMRLQLAKLKLVVAATKIGLWDMEVVQGDPVNPNNAFLWSDELRQMLGFKDENDFPNVTRSWSDLLHPEDKERTLQAFKNHLIDRTGKTPYDIEYRLKKKNGEYAFYRASGETVRNEDGLALRVAGALMDITETKNLLLDLETEKSLLQAMFDSVPDLIFCKDTDLNYTRCNESLEKYFNLKKNDLIGKNDELGLRLPQKIADEYRAMDRAVMNRKKIIRYEEYVPTPDGVLRLFETNKVPLFQSGNIVGIMGIARDITERKAMEEAAQSANKAKSAFLSTVSHEIRTPMNAILGITEIQLQNDTLDQNVREGLEKIYTSGDMLLGIINDILDLSKIEAGKLELHILKYEMASLINDIVQLNIMRIGSKPIEFDLLVDENMPAILLGDELRVKQILNNLLSNAFKYTAKGTVKMTVLSKPKDGSVDEVMLVIEVSDTGQGMTKEQVDRLFDEYSRFNQETNRSTEGTGLGMSITRNLVRMMNGEIAIKSEPGKGSVFTVFLPQGIVDSETIGKEMAENLHNFRSSSRAQMKRMQITREPMPYGSVLIVDDVETNIFVASGLLAPYELKIDSVDSGYGAIEKIKSGGVYDIVFMDHMMPKMDGIETTKVLREMGYKQPIVALTANAVAGQADMFLDNGFDDFISKPIDARQLNTVLNKLIRDKQPPKAVEEAKRHIKNEPSVNPKITENPRLIKIFARDVNKSIAALDQFIKKGSPYTEEEIKTYILHTHGMRSALANMGKKDLSAVAFKLEQLGRNNNTGAINAETPAFISSLRECVEKLMPEEEQSAGKTASDDTSHDDTSHKDASYLKEKLLAIKAACREYNSGIAENVLMELRHKAWPQQTRDLLETISEKLLHSDFDEIINAISSWLEEFRS